MIAKATPIFPVRSILKSIFQFNGPSIRRVRSPEAFQVWGHGVHPGTAPRMTAGKPPQPECKSTENPMSLHGFVAIPRTTRLKPTPAPRSPNGVYERRHHELVAADRCANQSFHEVSTPARRASLHHSASSSAKVAWEARNLATVTHHTLSIILPQCSL